MINQDKLLKDLQDRGMIKYDQLNLILEEAKESKRGVEEILEKIVNIEDLTQAKSRFYNLAYQNITELIINNKVLNIIPSEVAQNYKIICFGEKDKKIKVGIIDPDNFKAIEAVDFLAKENDLQAEFFLISKNSFEAAFKQYKSLSKELDTALKTRAKAEEDQLIAIEERNKPQTGEEVTKSAPVAKIVSVIIRHAVEGKSSDIHIEPLRNETRVRYRIDGVLHTSLVLPKAIHNALVARIKVLSNLKLDETRIPQDGRIRMIVNEREIDFRVSILPLVGFEKVVMRILDTTKGAPKLEGLGFQGRQLQLLQKNIKKTAGILLITGPTGSGKSTTLFSLLDMLNKEGINISTLEDPVEYKMEGVNQSQIAPQLGYNFASGLRSFLRQDPDIIMVGEIRDEETAELSVHAALTGHYVLSTLHTVDCSGVITRLVDMGIEPFLIGSTLNTVIAQRLARKICEFCREETKIPPDYLETIKAELTQIGDEYLKELIKDFDINKLKFFKGKGCPRCANTGYSGRVAIAEVLDVNKQIKDMIIEGKKYIDVDTIRKTQPFVTVRQDGFLKVIQGKTTIEEVLRVMSD